MPVRKYSLRSSDAGWSRGVAKRWMYRERGDKMGERVLIVDDNATNLKLASVVLGSAGFQVATANGAQEALDAVLRFQPRVILMDLHLPERDGLSLTRQLKGDPATSGIVIVAMTAHAMWADEARAYAAGCDGYITKPIDTRTVATAVGEYAARGSLTTSNRTDPSGTRMRANNPTGAPLPTYEEKP
jgi:CheY-like chemotaxis protein